MIHNMFFNAFEGERMTMNEAKKCDDVHTTSAVFPGT